MDRQFPSYIILGNKTVQRRKSFSSMVQCWTKACGKEKEDVPPTFGLASGNVFLVKSIEKWEEKMSEASDSGKIMVVNFSVLWCNPCRTTTPAYHELADKYTSIIFLTVDVDELAYTYSFHYTSNDSIGNKASSSHGSLFINRT